ncbi:CPBP family intramembrane glutamic endopeptidase [Flavobacterium sp. JP2137]|uniref:CPBP family intramembrane glutamic endopeptidase n=1 Tax=Flavobacterium sp. JP2137 TaxID=3414510 RepID=UPI003D2FD7FC
MQALPVSVQRILVFFVIAIVVSNVFRFELFGIGEWLGQFPAEIQVILKVLLEGSGVFIGALVGRYQLRKTRKIEMTLGGTSPQRALLMSVIPLVLVSVIGVKNGWDIQPNAYGLLAVVGSLIYCIMEEYGWRGYLQEELRDLKPWKRYLLIGFLWYFWHLSFLGNATPYENLFFLAMLILGSWGIGEVAHTTRSIVASACFHLIIQLMLFNSLIKNGLDNTQKFIVLGLTVLLWIIILERWKKADKHRLNQEKSAD